MSISSQLRRVAGCSASAIRTMSLNWLQRTRKAAGPNISSRQCDVGQQGVGVDLGAGMPGRRSYWRAKHLRL